MTSAKIKGREEREVGKARNKNVKEVKEMVTDITYYIRNAKF